MSALLDEAVGLDKDHVKEVPERGVEMNTTGRFSSAKWYEEIQKKEILIAGVGGIGSWTALALSKMRPKRLVLMDNDVVEDVNLAGQFYNIDDIGKNKVDAVSENIAMYSNYGCDAVKGLVDRNTGTEDITICGFDNMEARKLTYSLWRKRCLDNNVEHGLFVDGRLTADELQIFAITSDDIKTLGKIYSENYLFSDEEALPTVCSYKQTAYMASLIGSLICNIVVNHIANQCNVPIEQTVPFKTVYKSNFMDFKLENE